MTSRIGVLGSLALVVASVLVAAQSPERAPAPPARTPDGQPNLQGVWQMNTYTPLERPKEFAGKEFFTEAEARDFFAKAATYNAEGDPGLHYDNTEYGLDTWQQKGVRPNLRTSLIVDPPDGQLPPLTAEAQKRLSAATGRGVRVQSRSVFERCHTGYWRGGPMLKGVGSSSIPGLAGANIGIGAEGEVQILQPPGYIVILAQSNNDVRIVPLDGRPPLSSTMSKWHGEPRGRFEGETLVIESSHFNEKLEFLGATRAVRIVERLTRVDADTLRYRATVSDPNTWPRPWSLDLDWPKAEPPIFEFACHESNYGLFNVLRGARVQQSRGLRIGGGGN